MKPLPPRWHRFPAGPVALETPESFRRIGHCLLTLLVGIGGGSFARYRSEYPGDGGT